MSGLIPSFLLLASLSFSVFALYPRAQIARGSVAHRLKVIQRAPNDPNVELIQLSKSTPNITNALSDLLAHFKLSRHIASLVVYAGRADSVGVILLASVVCAVVLSSLTYLLTRTAFPPTCAAMVGLLIPYVLLRSSSSKRIKRFTEALPDAIDLMSRALRAGHSSGSSIEMIAEQSPKPLADEFGRCFQRQKFGIPFRDALLELAQRMPSRDLKFLITAILVQKETGGDLTQILDRATSVIRDRVRIEGEVRSYTAQGRLTGWILSALPLAMLGIINILTPGYTQILFADPLGQKLMYAAVCLILTGALTIRKIVDIKV